MALQHIRAFRARREEFGDRINQDIAHAIADAMGNDDSPATVAITTLAEEARCHYNTADKRTKEMADAGLIKIEKRPGKILAYSLIGEFEAVPYKSPTPHGGNDDIEKRFESLEEKVEGLVKVVEKLSHDLHTIVTSPSHDLHTTFTPAVNENVNKEEKKRRREEENIHTRELPSSAVPFPDEEEQKAEMITALSGEVKETAAIGFTDRKFDNAAAGLIARGIKPEQVKGFSTWWSENGFYNGKPSLSSLVTELDNFINGVKKKPNKNGHYNQPSSVPSQGLVEIEPGVF